MEWLQRLELESRSAAELNGRLQLLLQHQSLQLQQLAPAAGAAVGSAATVRHGQTACVTDRSSERVVAASAGAVDRAQWLLLLRWEW